MKVGAVSELFDLQAVTEAAQREGFYVIGRVVSFKDARLYAYDGGAHALWDRQTGEAWGVWRTRNGTSTQIEHWVDPYDPDVRA